MMKILVTGGAGFIGSHTVVELHHAGYESIIFDNFSNSEKAVITGLETIIGKPVTCYEADINDPAAWDKVFTENKIDGIIHFAAFKAVGESVSEPLKYYRNNVAATVLMLEKMQEHKVSNLVFSSSCTVYGQPESLPVTELSKVQPANSPYGNTKQICEEIITDTVATNRGLKAISLRYFNPIGAHESVLIGELPLGVPANLVPFITQTVAGLRGQLSVFGDDYPTSDGTAVRDYIHVVDLAKAHVAALALLLKQQEKTTYYDYFNIGTGTGSSVLEVITAFETATGLKVNYAIKPRREGDVTAVYADCSKSNEILGWKAEKTLTEALGDAWKWQLAVVNRK
ncbi:UDP-glucose 4-epimerase GalE [Flectobacillus longus]|uniref:UDP-glucose 4-epimerase GalE n=1 Tax=Flectobacillus longus TaxID=2984207 RepID=UPI0024B81F43|nr:UDP-glucose 4-epimerase GalE [Flectobacillus longus]MDI9882510.1 UDP-glucose 4-epimerase GalE [Flectobacillus longus]